MKDAHTLYKLIILTMLGRVDFELTNSQISTFILGEQYTDYFTLQETLSEMLESGLIEAKTIRNSTHYAMTESGRETLEYFGNDVSSGIRRDIEEYFRKNKLKMRNENSVIADYHRTKTNEFTAQLQVKEKNAVLVEVSLTVPLEQQAIVLCDNWKKKSQQIYGYLVSELM
ncbi:MAG: DUF4364 family protein [Eubacteriales bacterium]|nr:DUF4364 family protein [Eubacteriales bacterium]